MGALKAVFTRLPHFYWIQARSVHWKSGRRGIAIMSEANGSPTSSSHDLSVPSAVRGMVDLDKNLFQKLVSFPVIPVGAREVGRLRGCTNKYVIKNLGRNIKPVMNTEDNEKKLLVFNPAAVKDDTVKEEVLSTVREITDDPLKEFEEHSFSVGFDDWDLKTIFKAVLPDGLEYSSFTQTGHLIHCNFRDDLVPYRKIIGQILLEKVQSCKTVVYKPDLITTKFRTFQVELIAGEPNYVVETTEDGIRYKMDFTKVFWNSRLSHEHSRILKFITEQSLVFDACAGIGPFVLPAAKKRNARLVWGNDLNPDSVHWMKENIRLNKIPEGHVRVFNEDAVEFIRGPVAEYLRDQKALPSEERPDAAHFIMNLPALAVTFLPAFRGMLRMETETSVSGEEPFPVIVYCYLFAKAQEDVPATWYAEKAASMARQQLRCDDVQIRRTHEVRTVSNRKVMFCVECVLPWSLLYAEPLSEEEEKERIEELSVDQEEDKEDEEVPPTKKRKDCGDN